MNVMRHLLANIQMHPHAMMTAAIVNLLRRKEREMGSHAWVRLDWFSSLAQAPTLLLRECG